MIFLVLSQANPWTTAVSLGSVDAVVAVLDFLARGPLHVSQMVVAPRWESLKAGEHQLGKWLREVAVSPVPSK